MTPIWLEVHVDDVRLAEDEGVWPEVAALLDRLAGIADDGGARLSFRMRERFCELDRAGFVRALVRRGHEVGWHAHARRLRAARDAVVAAGGDWRVAAPGLVQARSRRVLLAEAYALGARVVTDRSEGRRRAYRGWLAENPAPGLTTMEVSVSPWAWGVIGGKPDFDRLSAMAQVATGWEAPPGSAPYFGATFHEHDVWGGDLEGFRRFCARWGERIVASATVGARPESRPRDARRGTTHRVKTHARSIQVGTVAALRVGPPHPRAAIVVVHGGASGLDQRLAFCGLPDDGLGDVAVWFFARTEGIPRAPGHPIHSEDTRAVLDAACAEGVPVGMLAWSGGIVPALAAADARVRLVVDVEGPADRMSLVAPEGNELADLDPYDDHAWRGREAVELVRTFAGRYVRIQGTRDHVHGDVRWHADRMVHAARDGELVRVRGRVRDHGATVAAVVAAAIGAG